MAAIKRPLSAKCDRWPSFSRPGHYLSPVGYKNTFDFAMGENYSFFFLFKGTSDSIVPSYVIRSIWPQKDPFYLLIFWIWLDFFFFFFFKLENTTDDGCHLAIPIDVCRKTSFSRYHSYNNEMIEFLLFKLSYTALGFLYIFDLWNRLNNCCHTLHIMLPTKKLHRPCDSIQAYMEPAHNIWIYRK